jgi:hypothetical protein
MQHFADVFDSIGRDDVTSIELLPTDALFTRYFSKQTLPTEICRRTDLLYSLNLNDDLLTITLSTDTDLQQSFPLSSSTTNELVEWITLLDQPRTTLVVTYDFQGNDVCSRVPRGIINGLPVGWQCEQRGAASFSSTVQRGQWKCRGPTMSRDAARTAIEEHYRGLSVQID